MLVLDENIIESQRRLLLRGRRRLCQIGSEVGRKGMSDEEVMRVLQSSRRATLITRDQRLYRPALRRSDYCIAVLAVPEDRIAEMTLRVLNHPRLISVRSRMGAVLQANDARIRIWWHKTPQEQQLFWPQQRKHRMRRH